MAKKTSNIAPMTIAQQHAYAAKLLLLATPEAQAGTVNPAAAAAFLKELAAMYAAA